ncbi:protein FAR1-RELATED SEQUENCE 5-like [Vicia villosa]|uniref:protein FAR1-RELATED SEQUENCE 5-like n=1 Tax=Vicia villosa TaxID=3911 RepID=UPI00273CC947|nr:protein FAR1-RELATED SEQUENCE 5-like [Vicia villosa]
MHVVPFHGKNPSHRSKTPPGYDHRQLTNETSSTEARLFKATKKMNLHVRRTIQINDDAEVRINKTFQSLVNDAEGHGNIPFCEKDVRNYIDKEHRVIGKEGDGKALIMSYLTNKYDMPFAAFMGVNHHGQSTLLGCGLLSGEDIYSFVWIFKPWLRCMLEKPPMGIVTDQCKAMKNAIELVFPTTRHRWCLWHIMKKNPEKLSGYGEHKRTKYTMNEAVYDTFTITSLEQKWCLLVEKFNVQENDWLGGLYVEHHRWAPTLLRKYLWAGMSTTQRIESIHALFDGYINSTTSLNQFVKQYDNALRSWAKKEFEANFNSMDTTIPCGSNSTIEKQFQNEFTHAKFRKIEVEFRSKITNYLTKQK